jgi:hypothetical protein
MLSSTPLCVPRRDTTFQSGRVANSAFCSAVVDAAFVQLLKSFEATLPLQRASELWDSKMRKRMLSLTDGIMVRICRLLEAASACAIKEGTESIEMEILTDQLANKSLVSISERRTRRAVG